MKWPAFTAVIAVLASCAPVGAEQPAMPNMFPTLGACTEALRSGQLRFYEPRYFGLATRNPANNADRVVVPLEVDMCLQMLVVGGVRFVAQREGTLFRAQKLADGSLSLYARHDCGNPVYNVMLPAPVHLTPEVQESPARLQHFVPPPPPQHRNTVFVPVRQEKKGGFCSSKKCRLTLAAIGGAAAGYAVWRYWPCPPGTTHR